MPGGLMCLIWFAEATKTGGRGFRGGKRGGQGGSLSC